MRLRFLLSRLGFSLWMTPPCARCRAFRTDFAIVGLIFPVIQTLLQFSDGKMAEAVGNQP